MLAAHTDLSRYGAPLLFVNESEREYYEPSAAPTQEHIETLKVTHELGIPTWASLEPVFATQDAYELINMTHEYVDIGFAGIACFS